MLSCPAALPLSLSHQALTCTAGVIRRHRTQTGSCWRKLSPGQRALLVLACLRKGETFAELAAGFGIGTAPPCCAAAPAPRQPPRSGRTSPRPPTPA